MPFHISPKGRKFLEMPSAAKAFGTESRALVDRIADEATAHSRAQYSSYLVGRPLVPSRESRASTQGRFEQLIKWEATHPPQGDMVVFDRSTMDEEAWYWIILEIGTGKSATILNTGESVAVPRQRGRELPRGFYWGNASGSPAGGPGSHNLFPYSPGESYTGYASTLDENGDPVRIKREIKAKHFVQEGGLLGFQDYREALTAAFEQLFIP